MIKDKNPAEFVDSLKNIDIFISHGYADDVVPIELHSRKLKELCNGNVFLEIIKNGGHSTDNYEYYNLAVTKAFDKIKKHS